MYYISYFLPCYDKYLTNRLERVYFGSWFTGRVRLCRSAWWQLCEAAGHAAPQSGLREMKVNILLAFSFSFGLRPPPLEQCPRSALQKYLGLSPKSCQVDSQDLLCVCITYTAPPIAKHSKIHQTDVSKAAIYPLYLNLPKFTPTHSYGHFIYSYMKFPPPDKLAIQPHLHSADMGVRNTVGLCAIRVHKWLLTQWGTKAIDCVQSDYRRLEKAQETKGVREGGEG